MNDRELMQQAHNAATKPCPEPLWIRNEEGKLELHAPPQREWQGLTEAERVDILDAELTTQNTEHFALAQAIEAKLKEKNT